MNHTAIHDWQESSHRQVSIFTIPKPWHGHFETIQRNAVRSWLSLDVDIMLLGDEPGTAEAAEEFGLEHIPEIEFTERGAPLLPSVFAQGQQSALWDVVAYVNADIILFPSFVRAIESVVGHQGQDPFLLIGGRWNVDVQKELDFTDPSLESQLRKRAEMCREDALDYFVFPKGTYDDIPSFRIGRFAWDNWLLDDVLRRNIPAINATEEVFVVHQLHEMAFTAGTDAPPPDVAHNLELYYSRFQRTWPVAYTDAPYRLKHGLIEPQPLRPTSKPDSKVDLSSPDPVQGDPRSGANASPGNIATEESPVLSVCMIVRDNERILKACLESIAPWVDEMVVVDTGSQDRTPDIARQCGARVSEFPWCDDFSAARNASLEQAHGRWLFWLDSDDLISAENGRQLRELALGDHDPRTLAYVMQVHCPSGHDGEADRDLTVVDHVKLLRNLPELRFEGRIHEQILPAIRRLNGDVQWTGIHVTHANCARTPSEKKRKQERDLRLLQLESDDRPDHPFTLFNLGMTYTDIGHYEEAINCLCRSILVAEQQESQVRKAYALLAHSWTQLGRYRQALEVLEKALAFLPQDTELQFRKGIVCHHLGRLDEAVAAYQVAMEGDTEQHFGSIDPGMASYKSRHNLALVYRDQGNVEAAQAQWEAALQLQPLMRGAWHGLVELAIEQGDLTHAQHLVERLRSVPQLNVDAQLAQADVYLAQDNSESATAALEATYSDNPEDVSTVQRYARHLFNLGCFPEAEQVLRQLQTLCPEDASVHHNLAVIHSQREDLMSAIDHCQAALQIDPNRASTRRLLEDLQQKLPVVNEPVPCA